MLNEKTMIILSCLQEVINDLLNLQTKLSKFENLSNGHRKIKIETIPGSKYSY